MLTSEIRTHPFYKNLSYYKNQRPPKKGQKFIDELFPPDNRCLNGDTKASDIFNYPSSVTCERASKIFYPQKYFLFEHSISPEDVIQGGLGDCYCLVAISALARYPNLIYQMFKIKEINKEGYFEIICFIDGKFQIVLLDDYFPINSISGKLEFAKSSRNELWVCLLEKVWAKLNGSYYNAGKDGGLMHHVLECFTGFPCSQFFHSITRENIVLDQILTGNKRDCIMTCASVEKPEGNLLGNHSYSILDSPTIETKGRKENLLELRNPWGKGREEWTGDWGDKSPLWGDEEKSQVKWIEKNDGEFFIDFNNYYKNMEWTSINYILYHSYTKLFTISGNNVLQGNVFNIYLENDGFFTLSQIRKNKLFNKELKGSKIPSFLGIVKYNPLNSDQNNYFSNYDGHYCSNNSNTLTKFLKKGFYMIYSYHDIPHSTLKKEDSYSLKFDSTSKFKAKLIPIVDKKEQNFPLLKQMIIQSVKDLKGVKSNENFTILVNEIMKDGIATRIVQNCTKDWMIYKEDPTDIKNMFILSPYDKKNTFMWCIPPGGSNCILGMAINSSSKHNFELKTQACVSKEKPNIKDITNNEFIIDLNKINLKEYANEAVSKDNNTNDNYYDAISLSLSQAKKDLLFGDSDSNFIKNSIRKEYPEILKKIEQLPKPFNSDKLSWTKIPTKKFVYIGEVNANSEKEGNGAIIWKESGKVFVGRFIEHQLNGKGYIYRDKSCNYLEYEGEFKNGHKEG